MTRHNAALNQQRDHDHHQAVNHAITNATGTTSGTADTHNLTLTDPADARQLRGIPAVGGRGTLGGHINGTRPDLIRFEHLRRKF